jgi:DNA repair protein RecO (recombination protein O)
MEWRDEGLIIGLKRHGESSVIVELMTQDHGRHLGIVKGGRSRRMQPFLQPGNSIGVVWRARLEEHLGLYAVEPLRERAGEIMDSGLALAGLNLIGEWLRLLPERESHVGLWALAEALSDNLADPHRAPPLMVRFELTVLTELGFGLDLERCAATGQRHALEWVSPRTGRAVSREAGAPYADRLLPLPPFLQVEAGAERGANAPPSREDVFAGFRLLGHFLARDVLDPRGMLEPEARRSYLSRLGGAPEF